MNYTSAVSIIPGGCPQFLDCRLDAKSLGRFWAYFREIPQTGESAIASARRQVELVPVPLDDTGQPGDYDYKIDAKSAARFDVRWIDIDSDVRVNGTRVGKAEIDPWVVGVSYVYNF